MTGGATDDHFGNPFSTRYVRPGAIAFRFPPGESAVGLVERLAQNGWRGQIVGPHGSGKSSLIAALGPHLQARGRAACVIALHDGERRLPVDPARSGIAPARGVIIVDGYEQLGRLSRWRLGRTCRKHDWGLLVTAHRSVNLPTLIETRTSLEVAQQIVAQLAPHDQRVGRDDVARSFERTGGNLREMLFDLYDLYEIRRAGTGITTERT